jgi:hypothetical protein
MRGYRAQLLINQTGLPFRLQSWLLVLVLLTGLSLTACQRTAMPKPVAEQRLAYPDSGYTHFSDSHYPFEFEYPSFFKVITKPTPDMSIRWVDLRWERYGLTLHTTYQRFTDTGLAAEQPALMAALLDEKRPKGTTVKAYTHPLTKQGLTAYVFVVEGNSPIPMEFIVTDGLHHSFSGRLLFDNQPNSEAMADILAGITKDMQYLMDHFTLTQRP